MEVLDTTRLDSLLRTATDPDVAREKRCEAAASLAELARTQRLRDAEPSLTTYALWFAALGAAWEAAEDHGLAHPLREAFAGVMHVPEFKPDAASEALTDEVLVDLCARFEAGVAEEKPFLRDVLYWVYLSFPKRRPMLRRRLGSILMRFTRLPNRTTHVSEILQVLGQVARGFHAPPLTNPHLSLLRGVLLPLHRPNEMLEWRDQIPLLETYHEALVYAVVQFLENDASLAVEVLEAVVLAWPEGFHSNTPKEVLLLHEVETVLKYVPAPPKGSDVDNEAAANISRVWQAITPKLLRCLSVDNSRVVEKSLFMWKSEHFLALAAPQLKKLMRPLLGALLRGGHPFWNPTVNKMSSHVLETLERLEPEAFRQAAEDLWGAGRTLPTVDPAETIASQSTDSAAATTPLLPANWVARGVPGGVAAAKRRLGPPAPAPAAAAAPKAPAPQGAVVSSDGAPMTAAPWASGSAPVSLRSAMGGWKPSAGQKAAPPPATVTGVAPWAFSGGAAAGANGGVRAASGGAFAGRRSGKAGGSGGAGAFPPLKRPLPPPFAESEPSSSGGNGAAAAGLGEAGGLKENDQESEEEDAFEAVAEAADAKASSDAPEAHLPALSAQGGGSSGGGSGRFDKTGISDAGDEERTDAEAGEGVGLRRVHDLMAKLKPKDDGGEGGGPAKWLEEQMAPTPTLLPSLRFHDLVFGHELGQGTFSVVRYARRITPGLTRSHWPEYAVKVVSAAKIRELRYARSVANEVALLHLLAHPSIARMVSAFRWRDGAYLVLEYASRGDLHAHIVKNGSLDEDSARFVTGEVVAALCSVHDAGFVYGDLKPENVLITESGHVKLADFGACRPATPAAERLLEGSRNALQSLRDGDWRAARGLPPAANDPGAAAFAPELPGGAEAQWWDDEEAEEEENGAAGARRAEGTAAYLPPEVVRGAFPDLLADAWALGCLVYQCLSGRPPLYADTEEEVWAHAVRFFGGGGGGGGGQLADLPAGTSKAARSLISALMEHEPQRRLTVEASATCAFFAGLDVFALHRGPAITLAGGAVTPAPGAAWSRRQNSMVWAPMPTEFAFEQASQALAAIEESQLEEGTSFLPGLGKILED